MKKSARFNLRNILSSIVIVAFGLGVGFLMFQNYVPVEVREGNVLGASTFSMPKIGAETLADPEYYTPALAGIGSEDEIRLQDAMGEPSRSETPPSPAYGFGLKAESSEDLSEISFIVHKQDGSVVGPYLVELAEDIVDRDGQPISGAFTDPYLFAAGVAKVDFFNTDNKEFTIKYIEFMGQGDEETIDTQTVISDANKLYKDRFMQEAGLNIVTRDEYGAADDNIFAPGWTPPYYAVNRIVVHHTATGVDMNNPANTVAAIWRYHTYDLDWGDVGYNFLIDPYGNIYEGRAGINGVRGNHAPPNEGSIGISLLGDFTNQLPTQAALDSLVRLTAYLAKVNQINLVYKTSFDSANPEGMYGHRAINATACPGNTFFPLLPQVRDAAASLMAQQGEIDVKINQVNTMVDGREYYQTDTATQILIKLDGLPDLLKEKLRNPPPRFALKIEQDDSLIYEIPKDMLKQSLTELKVVAPEAVSQPNYKYELQAWVEDAGNERSVPTDYNATEHWYLEQIQAPEAWYYLYNNTDPQSHTGSSSVKVAVIDTGVAYEDYNFSAGSDYDRQYYKSPDLDNATFTDPYDAAFDYLCQYRSLTLDPCTAGEWAKVDHANDDQGHGTFVSSVIGATISDAAPNILLGIAPSVKIIPIKVSLPVDSSLGLDSGAIYTNFLEMGIDHARLSGANVINISLGAESSEDPYLLDAINDAYNAGITIVASSGNHTLPGDAEYVLFPANLDNVIAVGASNYAGDARATYSNYGPELDVVAPVGSGTGDGGVIASTLSCFTTDCTESSDLSLFPPNGSYIRGWGTSFAAPQVAAQAALIKSIYSTYSNTDIIISIITETNDISPIGKDNLTGFGRIQLYESLLEVSANIPNPSVPGPHLSKKYYFPLYSNWNNDYALSYFEFSNPNQTSANVTITIGNTQYGDGGQIYNGTNPYIIPPNGRIYASIPFIHLGPVTIETVNDTTFLVYIRSIWQNKSLDQLLPITEGDISKKYYFPLYSNWDSNYAYTYLEFSNPNLNESQVKVQIGEVFYGENGQIFNGNNPIKIPPKNRLYVQIPYIHNGPLIVETINDTSFFVYTRSIWQNKYLDQLLPFTDNMVSTKYFFPLYSNWDNNYAITYIELSNPSDITSQVTITIADKVYGSSGQLFNGSNPITIPPHDRTYTQIPYIHNGPVTVESINAVEFLVYYRSIWKGKSLDQLMPRIESQISSRYYFPLYSNWDNNYAKTYLELSNLNQDPVFVTVKIGSSTYGVSGQIYNGTNPISIPANGRTYTEIPYIHNGPVMIESLNGRPFLVYYRSIWQDYSLDQINPILP